MVYHADGQRNVSRRERIKDRVACDDSYGRGCRRRAQIDAHDVDSEFAMHTVEKSALPTAYVQDAPHRGWIRAEKSQNFGRIAQPSMRSGEVPIYPGDDWIR